ncbi:hypothetical protein LEMLEM_LOCUS11040, partial [Lemmus lemmus]
GIEQTHETGSQVRVSLSAGHLLRAKATSQRERSKERVIQKEGVLPWLLPLSAHYGWA